MRRHTLRNPDGDISPEGVVLAERARRTLEFSFDIFMSSPKRRAVQTLRVLAGGDIAVVKEPRLTTLPDEVDAHGKNIEKAVARGGISYLRAAFALDGTRPHIERHGKEALAAVTDAAARLRENGRCLAVSHGGTIEAAALVALDREWDIAALGGELAECEGVKFFVEECEVMRVDVVRLL